MKTDASGTCLSIVNRFKLPPDMLYHLRCSLLLKGRKPVMPYYKAVSELAQHVASVYCQTSHHMNYSIQTFL